MPFLSGAWQPSVSCQLPKCVAQASGKAHREAAKKALQAMGIPVHQHAKDLGTDAAPTARRVKVQRQRAVKATQRLVRIARLPEDAGVRAQRSKAYALSASHYGVEIQGMGRTAQGKLRTSVAGAIRPGAPARGCPMTLLALQASRADPMVETPVQVVARWARRAWMRSGSVALP